MKYGDIQKQFRKFPKAQSAALEATFESAMKLLPGAEIAIAWNMPTLKVGEINVLHVQGFKSHNSLFPSSGAVVELIAKEVKGLTFSKGTMQFEAEVAMKPALIKKIVQIRIDQINGSFPTKSGLSKAFYANGFLKYEGKLKDGNPHGAWKWYRIDGTLMRSGSFKNGDQSGIWVTYDRNEEVVKQTQF